MRNIETKVRVAELVSIRARCQQMVATFEWHQRQLDTYFAVPSGRLKLREQDEQATLIAYQRPDVEGVRTSQYELYPVADASHLKRTLSVAPGILTVVDKQREFWLFGRTRIHLDQVEELGTFVELETVITSQSQSEAATEHHQILRALELHSVPTIAGSYSNLLIAAQSS